MIGAAGVSAGQSGRSQIAKRLEPGAENRAHGFVALQVDAANLARAVVEVEIGRELIVGRFERDRSLLSLLPLLPLLSLLSPRSARSLARGVMHVDVGARADKPLLFAAPQPDAYRPARLDAQRLNDADDLHRDSRSRAVVRGAGSRMPRIEMSPDHHDLVFEIRAGNFGDHVVAHQILVVKLRIELYFEFDRDAFGLHTHQALVMLSAQRR